MPPIDALVSRLKSVSFIAIKITMNLHELVTAKVRHTHEKVIPIELRVVINLYSYTRVV